MAEFRTPLPDELRRLKATLTDAWREFLGNDPRQPDYTKLLSVIAHTRTLAQEVSRSRVPANEVQIAKTHLKLANQIYDLTNELEIMAALRWLEYQLAVLAVAHADLVHDIAWLRSSKAEGAESFLALSVRVVELRNRMIGCAAAIEHFSSRLDG